MKFSGQKFFIILGLFLIPFLFVGALLREPVVNQGLLKITLSILKKRLGSNLKAQTWKIDISKFAVAIEGIEVERNKIKVSVDEFRAEFSPLFLVIGRVQLSKVWVNGVRVEGTFKIPESSEKEPFHLEKKLNLFADKVVDIQNLMNKRKVDFDNVELSNVSLNSNIVNFKRGDIVLENIGPGHVKLEFAFENLTGNTLVPPINRVVASAVILKDLNRAYLSLRRFNVDLDLKEKLHTTLELRGRIPGEFSVDFSSNLAGLSKWVSSLKTTWSESLKAA